MTWAAKRRLVIGLLIAGFGIALLSILGFALLYQAPTCSDGKQNQDEEGIDCGGGCAYVCNADAIAPVTLYATLITTKSDRVDLVAAIENRNGDLGAEDVSYQVMIYTKSGTLAKEFGGSLDLPPRTVVPLFLPGVGTSGDELDRAFVTIDSAAPKWITLPEDPRILPLVAARPIGGTPEAPRIQADLTNPSLLPMSRVPVVVFVRHSVTGNVIAASQTVVPYIEPQASGVATFVWNEPFGSEQVRVEVMPVIALP